MPLPHGAIVGYTNAGKSSLLNKLTQQRCARRGQTLRHARHQHPPHGTARRPAAPAHGHGRLCAQAAARSGAKFPCHAGRSLLADFLIHVVDASHPAREGIHQDHHGGAEGTRCRRQEGHPRPQQDRPRHRAEPGFTNCRTAIRTPSSSRSRPARASTICCTHSRDGLRSRGATDPAPADEPARPSRARP